MDASPASVQRRWAGDILFSWKGDILFKLEGGGGGGLFSSCYQYATLSLLVPQMKPKEGTC